MLLKEIFRNILMETPQRIPPLRNDDVQRYADSYLRILTDDKFDTTKLFKINDNISVYKSLHPLAGSYYAIYDDGISRKVIYLMEYERENIKFIGNIAKGSLVWASSEYKIFLKNLPVTIFFQHLLPSVHTYIGDTSYTSDGERFLKNTTIPKALRNNIYVYYIDTTKKLLIPVKDVSDLDYLDQQHNIWSAKIAKISSEFENRRFIFSETPILW